MPRRPKQTVSMQGTFKNIYTLKNHQAWIGLPLDLRNAVDRVFDGYLLNGRIIGTGLAATGAVVTSTRAAGNIGGPRVANRTRRTPRTNVARRTRGPAQPAVA